MGPGLFSPDDGVLIRPGHVQSSASMGLGLFSPDDHSSMRLELDPDSASMGPGLFSPDDHKCRIISPMHLRCFNGAGLIQPG